MQQTNKMASSVFKPLIKIDGTLYHNSIRDLTGVSYIWNESNATEPFVSTGFETRKIKTYHTFGHVALFKPSCAEVLERIPTELTDQVARSGRNGYYITEPENEQFPVVERERHVGITTLYIPIQKSI